MAFEDVKAITEAGDDDKLVKVYALTERRLIGILNLHLADVSTVPIELDYILDEVAISRYNRVGAEGMKSESVEGHSTSYSDDDFLPFMGEINHYIDKVLNRHRRGRITWV